MSVNHGFLRETAQDRVSLSSEERLDLCPPYSTGAQVLTYTTKPDPTWQEVGDVINRRFSFQFTEFSGLGVVSLVGEEEWEWVEDDGDERIARDWEEGKEGLEKGG